MKIAIFDVCGTLYNSNTTFDFLDNYFSNNKKYLFFRKISNLFIVKVLNHYIYKYMKIDIIRIYGTSFLKNETINNIHDYSKKFVYKNLEPKIKSNIYDMLKTYKNNNYKIVLMSGSYEFIIEHVNSYVDADFFFASELKKSDTLYYGSYEKDILLNKYQLLKENFPNITELIVISDNKTDLSLMLEANEALAICNKKKHYGFWKKNKNKKIKILEDYYV